MLQIYAWRSLSWSVAAFFNPVVFVLLVYNSSKKKNKVNNRIMDNQEIKIAKDDFIVSKTDPKGKITYCNRVFIDIAGYSERELLGQPHNIIRHPDMPRSVFRLMWETLQAGHEFFGLIKNRTKTGQFYWALANVTPSYDKDGQLLGYYSVRRCPARSGVKQMDELYREMTTVESQYGSAREAMDQSIQVLEKYLTSNGGIDYEELVLSYTNPDD